jgi:hypothetical protein
MPTMATTVAAQIAAVRRILALIRGDWGLIDMLRAPLEPALDDTAAQLDQGQDEKQ